MGNADNVLVLEAERTKNPAGGRQLIQRQMNACPASDSSAWNGFGLAEVTNQRVSSGQYQLQTGSLDGSKIISKAKGIL